jgi:hypothetical protein
MPISPSVPTLPPGGEKWYVRFAKAVKKVPRTVFKVLTSVSKETTETVRKFFGHTAKLMKRDRKVGKIEEKVFHPPSVSVDEHRAASPLSGAIETFREGSGSFQDLQKAVLHAEQYYGTDPLFRPFLQTTEKLFKHFEEDDRALRELVLPLLDQVLVRGEIPVKRGDEIGASLLFLSDHGGLDVVYEKATLQERLSFTFSLASQKLVEGEKSWRKKLLSCVCSEISLFGPPQEPTAADLIVTTFPRSIAADLMLSRGEINVGLIPLIEKAFLRSDTEIFETAIPGSTQEAINTTFKREREAIREAADAIYSDMWLQMRFAALSSI